jgi:hypothetical protein
MSVSHVAAQLACASRASDDSRRHRLPDRRIHCGLHRPGGYVLCSHGNAVPGNFEEPVIAQHNVENTNKLATQYDQILDLQRQQLEMLKSLNGIQAAIDGIQARLTGGPNG